MSSSAYQSSARRSVRAPEAGGAQQWTLTRTLSRSRCGRGLREKIAEANYSVLFHQVFALEHALYNAAINS
jgi:hypothetical protein